METKEKNLEHQKKIQLCYYWLYGNVFLSFLAIFTAIFPYKVPNITLLCYGFALLCMWQAFFKLQWYLGFLNNHRKEAIKLFLMGVFFLYTSALSSASAYSLFPHPSIHYYLILVLYISGVLLSLKLIYFAYLTWENKQTTASKIIRTIILYEEKIQKKRFEQWQHNKEKTTTEITFEGTKFQVNFITYFGQRLWNMLVWMLIPTWVYIVVPLNTLNFQYNRFFTSLSTAYVIGAIITLLVFVLWFFYLLLSSNPHFFLSKTRLQLKDFFKKQSVLWEQTKKVIFQENNIKFLFFDAPTLQIPLKDIQDQKVLLGKIFQALPVEIFFISKTMLKKLQKNKDDTIIAFLHKYKRERLAVDWETKQITQDKM